MITKNCDRCGKLDNDCVPAEMRLEIPGIVQSSDKLEVCLACAPEVAATYAKWLDEAFPYTAKVRASKGG